CPRDAPAFAWLRRGRDVDAIHGGHCRSDEPRGLGHKLAPGFHTDVWQNVHVRRGHVDAAWRNFSALHERKHAAGRRSDRCAELDHGDVFPPLWSKCADRRTINDESRSADRGWSRLSAFIPNWRIVARSTAARSATSP